MRGFRQRGCRQEGVGSVATLDTSEQIGFKQVVSGKWDSADNLNLNPKPETRNPKP